MQEDVEEGDYANVDFVTICLLSESNCIMSKDAT